MSDNIYAGGPANTGALDDHLTFDGYLMLALLLGAPMMVGFVIGILIGASL